MILVFYGKNRVELKKEAEKVVSDRITDQETEKILINQSELSEDRLKELSALQGLFGQLFVVFLYDAFSYAETEEFCFKNLEKLKDSKNIFLFLEEGLNKNILKKLEDYAEIFFFKQEPEKRDKEIFQLTDAFGDRDKKKSWLLFQNLKNKGKDPEEVFNIIFWQVKNMLLLNQTKNPTSAKLGLHPFVFQKNLKFVSNFSQEELEEMAYELSFSKTKIKMGKITTEEKIEELILKNL